VFFHNLRVVNNGLNFVLNQSLKPGNVRAFSGFFDSGKLDLVVVVSFLISLKLI